MSSERLVDEIANDFVLLCSRTDATVEAATLRSRLEMFSDLTNALRSLDPSTQMFAKALDDQAENMSNMSVPADFIERLSDLKRMQRLRLQKLEHEMMAKLINKNDDKSTLLTEQSQIRQSIETLGGQLNDVNKSDNVRRLVAHLLWHLASGLEASFKIDPPEEDLPEIDSDNYDLS